MRREKIDWFRKLRADNGGYATCVSETNVLFAPSSRREVASAKTPLPGRKFAHEYSHRFWHSNENPPVVDIPSLRPYKCGMQTVPIAIVAALDDEIRTMKSRIDVDSRVHIRPALFIMGKLDDRQVLLVRSGVGLGRMRRAAKYLADNYRPDMCLHVGYCGGCDPRFTSGDLIIASSVLNQNDDKIVNMSEPLVKKAEDVCRRRELRFGIGRIVSVEKPVRTPHEKAFVGTHHGAVAIDMESSAFVEIMSSAGIPNLVVRAVVDSLDVSLPVFGGAMGADGSIDSVALAGNMIRSPKNILEIPKIACCANQARQAISTFIGAWQEGV